MFWLRHNKVQIEKFCSLQVLCSLLFIIQQEQMMTELQSYITQNPPPADTPSVQCTLKSHDRVHVKDVKVIENIKVGYSPAG